MTARRTYRHDPAWLFTLRLDGTGKPPIVIRAFEIFDHPDKSRDHMTVEVVERRRIIFPRGQLWVGSPVRGFRDGLDGRDARDAALSLVGMAPGDTDADYFADYTEEQLAWAMEHRDRINLERERRFRP